MICTLGKLNTNFSVEIASNLNPDKDNNEERKKGTKCFFVVTVSFSFLDPHIFAFLYFSNLIKVGVNATLRKWSSPVSVQLTVEQL